MVELRFKCDGGGRAIVGCKRRGGFSLIELLVVVAIIALLIAIMVPALNKGRRNARAMQTMNNQRLIVVGVTGFASDNNGKYPESVATAGSTEHWNWQEPTMLTSYRRRDPQMPRSMSAYLRSYITDAGIMFCPNAPRKYEYLEQAWEAGDEWDNPQTAPERDPVMGTYCFYWNYIGLLEADEVQLKGPVDLSGGPEQSRLLVSDYFGYGHWRNRLVYNTSEAYGSCERIKGARITPGTAVSSAFWSRRAGTGDVSRDVRRVQLHAGYTDGHVERYRLADAVPMRVSKTANGSAAYPEELGPGQFYVPESALY